MEQKYLSDASNYVGNPSKVLKPNSKDELIQIIEEFADKNINITFFGSGTGLTGGAVAETGVLVSFENMNQVLAYNKGLVTVQPGITYSELNSYLEEKSRFYPPKPTETSSSIGGNVATNASGSRTFKYGATRNWVQSIKLVLANGELIELTRGEMFEKNGKIDLKTLSGKSISIPISDIKMPKIKHAAGYYLKGGMDAIDLFIGSEGTLACIYEITLKTLPKFDSILGLIIFFDDKNKIVDFVEEVRNESKENHDFDISVIGDVNARLIEYFDDRSLDVLRKHYSQIPLDAKGAIWIEQEYYEVNEPLILDSWFEIISRYTGLKDDIWSATNDKEHRFFAEFRHKLPQEVYENLSSNQTKKIGTDTAVPDDKFEDYFNWMNQKLEALNIPFLVFGHIGNSHLHANIFYRGENQMNKAIEFYDELISETVKLGGTVSAEHGIGKIKKKYLEKMFPKDSLNQMKEIKKTLDPKDIFGRGNLFDI